MTASQAVLLVEDNLADVEYVSHLLEGTAYTVTSAATIAEAEHLLGEGGFHAVLLDLRLPGTEPIAAAQRVVARANSVPVIALTQLDGDLAYQCLDAGLQDFVRKDGLSRRILVRTLEHAAVRARVADVTRRLEVSERQATLGSIAAYVAHEVNNLAAVLLAQTALIHEDLEQVRIRIDAEGDALVGAAVGKLEEQARIVERIAGVVSHLKSLSSASNATRRSTDVARLVERTVQVMNSRLRQSAIVALALEPCGPAAIDEHKLAQVLVNLLRNAAEAVSGEPAAQRIVVRLSETPTDVRLSVSDTGGGIPAEHRSRLFRPFFSSKPDGAGLGLAISSEIVASAGGRITVDTEVGRGTTFTVVLPRGVARREPSDTATPVRAPRIRRRVLLVDDDVALTKTLALCLKPHHEISVVSNGAHALELLETASFDVILCDLMMPRVDGVALYEAIRAKRPELLPGFAILSGGAFTASTSKFVESSQVMVIAKPCPVDRLLDAVDRLAVRG